MTIDPATLPRSALRLSRHLRDEARRLDREGVAWQCLIDGLRPHTVEIWESLAPAEKARFMNKLRPFWEVLRHRAAMESLAALDTWRRSERLEILAGNVTQATEEPSGLSVELGLRDGRSTRRRFDRVILCTGPQTDVRRWRGLLFRNLLQEGRIQADPLGLGLVTDPEGRAIDREGKASPWLYTLGSLRRARLWETTALPDIVRQAEALALRLRAG